MVPKFATISHGAPPVLSNIYFASKLNPLFYFTYFTWWKSVKYYWKKHLSMSTLFVCVACNTSSFDQNMVMIFTRLRTKGPGQISSFFIFGCFCFGYPLRFWAEITYCRVVWCGPRGIVHDLELPFQINYIPHFSMPVIPQSSTTSLCIWSEVYSPSSSRTKTCNIFNYLRVRTIDHEANTNFRATD